MILLCFYYNVYSVTLEYILIQAPTICITCAGNHQSQNLTRLIRVRLMQLLAQVISIFGWPRNIRNLYK
jgi:hypothetical protein